MESIYYSWWTKPDPGGSGTHDCNFKNKIKFVKLVEQSVFLVKKAYPKSEVVLITDTEGLDFFKDYNIFHRIIPALDDLSSDYKLIWSLGKIKAYEFAAEKGKPFIHLDNDFFISKKFKDDFINSEVFAQSIDEPHHTDNYSNVSKFFELVKKKPSFILKDLTIEVNGEKRNSIYNMGVFGGQNTSLIKKYSSEVIDMVLNKENSEYFCAEDKSRGPFEKACVTEQYSFGSFCHFYGIKPGLLMNEGDLFRAWQQLDLTLDKYSFVHLQGDVKDIAEEWFDRCLFNKIDKQPNKIDKQPRKRAEPFHKPEGSTLWPPRKYK